MEKSRWRAWFRGKRQQEPSRALLTERQQLILGLLLVVLLAVSLLYCLGFASLAIRQNWEKAPLPWSGTSAATTTSGNPASVTSPEPPAAGTAAP